MITFPYIAEKMREGKLKISGWHYIIETGEVFIYDRKKGEFLLGKRLIKNEA